MTMRLITDQDHYVASHKRNDAGEVIIMHCTNHASLAKGAGYEMEWTFNFKDVTRQELEDLTAKAMTIKLRPRFKGTKEKPKAVDHGYGKKTFSVREWLDETEGKRLGVDKGLKAERAIGNLTLDEQRELVLKKMKDLGMSTLLQEPAPRN